MKTIRIILLSGLALFLFSCGDKSSDTVSPAPTPQPTGKKLLGTTYISGAATRAQLYGDGDLFTGYAKLYVALSDSVTGKEVSNAEVTFLPVMSMGSMSHKAPVENPVGDKPVNGFFTGAVMFTMPSSGSNVWAVNLHVLNKTSNKSGSGQLQVNVKDPVATRLRLFTAANDNSNVYIGVVNPASPQVGINDIEFVLFRVVSDSFPPVTDYSIAITPLMPSMGHGSPNNVNPVHDQNGHYKGKVNFTMSGLWRVNLLMKKGSATADSTTYFEFTPGS